MVLMCMNSMVDNGCLLEVLVIFYFGVVMYQWMKLVVYWFSYLVFNILIDLDWFDVVDYVSWIFLVNWFNVLFFYEKDYGLCDGSFLWVYVDWFLIWEGFRCFEWIVLLVYLCLFGYGFNLLSVYYVYGDDGVFFVIVYEVCNIFGGLYIYVVLLYCDQLSDVGVCQDQCKEFYVLLFILMVQYYYFWMLFLG